jgi:AraC-like DNA-binding protein/ligand-binding sensor protein
MNNGHKQLLESLTHSGVFREFQSAYGLATRLPLVLRPVEAWQLPFCGVERENRFCALLGRNGRACAVCLQFNQKLVQQACTRPATFTCWCGLTASAVPVEVGGQVIGLLQTGQIFRAPPRVARFDRSAEQMQASGQQRDLEALRQAYLATRQVLPQRYGSFVNLLAIFGRHLSLLAGQIAAQTASAEPPMIRRAKEFILEHHAESLRLPQVAQAAGSSTFHFCKVFKRVTGVNFTAFLSQVRLEKAKNLLLNPDIKVSEIAYAVGFQSLTHFNRVFKEDTGHPPTHYRSQAIGWRGKPGTSGMAAKTPPARTASPAARSPRSRETAPAASAPPGGP